MTGQLLGPADLIAVTALHCVIYYFKITLRVERNWGGFSTNGRIFFLCVEFLSYIINGLNHFLRLLRRTSRDRYVY